MSNYIDLHNHSTFSLQDGFGTPDQIAERAVKLGWSAASITEHGWLGSSAAFYKACRKYGIKPIIGCEFYVTPDHAERTKEYTSQSYHLTVLALSREGYQNLVAWNTFSHRRENFYRKPRISISEMVEQAKWPLHHNVILSGCLGSELCTALKSNGDQFAPLYIESMKQVFPNFYLEIQNHSIPKWTEHGFEAYEEMLDTEFEVRAKLQGLAIATDTPLVLTNDSHYQHPKQRRAHMTTKASAWRHRDDTHYGLSKEQLISSYANDYVYYGSYLRKMEGAADGIPDQALESIAEIVEEANISIEPLDNFSYSIPFSGYHSPIERIRRRARARLQAAVGRHGDVAADRFEYELESMGDFAHYLLLMSDFIIGARKQGILTWTRGSVVCSFLCYCLKIHDIDSIEYGLTFSRFFNPARKKLPDIDIDVDPARYDDFMRQVQEKMEPLIGEGQVVQICNYGTAANRSAFRMAASALGVPKEEQDEISKLLPQMIDSGVVEENTDIFMALRDEYPEIYELTSTIFDSVKSVSQHASAWVFGTPDQTVEDWMPLYLIASSGTMVTQFDFKTVEEFGFVKGDFLRLKSLTVASNILRMIGKSPLDFHKLPLDDEATFEMIRSGRVEGVHTLQGKETRRGAVAMEVETIDDLITAAALYRPANTREGKDRIFNKRRKGQEEVLYPHEIVEKIAGPTQGLAVFQEQAMEIGYAVGMDDAGVDDIYQAIKTAKGTGRGAKEAFAEIKPRFMKAARKLMPIVEAEMTWDFIREFQGYGLNKGHATSMGILADKMAYLKCNYPAEHFAALLEVFPEKPRYLAAARAEGYKFVLPDVNYSHGGFSIAENNGIRVGLSKIHGVGPVAVREILENQPYSNYSDFISRTKRSAVKANNLTSLQRVGAFESLGIKGDNSDDTEYEILAFTTGRPKAFRNCKPKHVGARVSESGWEHQGYEKGVEISEGRSSVSKRFWIPASAKLELKSSPWAQVKTWLLAVVDENGIPMQLMVNEDRDNQAKLLQFLHRKCKGAVVCCDGSIRLPFVANGPQGFRFFGVTGTYQNDPQIWHVSEKFKKMINAHSKGR